jgi:ABC-2 type transport system permease protein
MSAGTVKAPVVPSGEKPLLPLLNPGRVGGLRDVIRRRYLLKLLVRKELKVRYSGSSVGLLWSYVKPAMRFAMYYWIVGLLISHNMENRGLHIFSGMVAVHFISNAFGAGCRAVVKNASLVKKINMPRETFPVASILVSAYHMIPMYVIMITACLFIGYNPDMTALIAALMSLVIVLIWGLAIAMLLSAWNVFFRDTQNVVDVLQTLITWTTPMIYPFGIVMDKLEQAQPILYQIYLSNPLTIAVLLNNRAFWTPTSSHPREAALQELPPHLFERGAIAVVAGLLFLWLAQAVFARLELRFAEKL